MPAHAEPSAKPSQARRATAGGIVLGVLVTGACLLGALILQFVLYAEAGGTLGFFGEPSEPPTVWWYGPTAAGVWLAAAAIPTATFAWATGARWWKVALVVPVVAGAWVAVAIAIWGA